MFEELIKKFHIKYGKLQIAGYHGKQDPRRTRTVQPAESRFSQQRRNDNSLAALRQDLKQDEGTAKGQF